MPSDLQKVVVVCVIVAVVLVGIITFNAIKPEVEDYEDVEIKTTEDEYDFILRNLVSGGPPKDGIPSIDNPQYISVAEAEELGLEDEEKVLE